MRLGINDALAQSGRRVTGPRQALVELIAEHRGHFTAAELMAEARREHIRVGRATVFRTLDLLTEIAALERLDLPSGEHAYVACEPEQHHHHVICRSCGKSVDVEDTGLQSVVREISSRSGYKIDSHRLELYGLCPACQAAIA
ncbi:MAG TPA: Fur family transcriptional regulator [Candidatus Limnocylindrales bacterium]|nr:Fur family transcriptional regulator [Candidatus Limnocylindrales bacterium]